MRAIDATRRSGVAIAGTRSVLAAAQIMKQADVGALAVVDDQQRLVGIVTDRDIVSRAVATGLSLDDDLPISEVMTAPVATIPADADLHDAYALFRTHKRRRLAIVRDDEFVGMLSVDDLLIDIAGDLSDLTRPVGAEVFKTLTDDAYPVGTGVPR